MTSRAVCSLRLVTGEAPRQSRAALVLAVPPARGMFWQFKFAASSLNTILDKEVCRDLPACSRS